MATDYVGRLVDWPDCRPGHQSIYFGGIESASEPEPRAVGLGIVFVRPWHSVWLSRGILKPECLSTRMPDRRTPDVWRSPSVWHSVWHSRNILKPEPRECQTEERQTVWHSSRGVLAENARPSGILPPSGILLVWHSDWHSRGILKPERQTTRMTDGRAPDRLAFFNR